jgi:hypothetical protein
MPGERPEQLGSQFLGPGILGPDSLVLGLPT